MKKLKNKNSLISMFFVLLIIIFVASYNISTQSKEDAQTNTKTIKDISTFNQKLTGSTTTHLPPGASGYGIRLFNMDGEFVREEILVNGTNNFNYFLSIANANPDDDAINFMIIVDNQIVPFKIDQSSTQYKSYEMELQAYSLINLPISFELPESLNAEKKYKIQFICQTKADKKTVKETEYIFNAIAKLDKFIEVEQGALPSYTQTSVLNDSSFVNLSKELTKNDYGLLMDITSASHQKDINQFIFTEGEQLNFFLTAYGEKSFYSSIVFLDNTPIKLYDETEVLNWEMEEGKQLKYSFSLNPLPKGEHTLFALTLKNSSDTSIFETRKYTLEIK